MWKLRHATSQLRSRAHLRNVLLAAAALVVVVAVAFGYTNVSTIITGLIALGGLWLAYDAHHAESPRLSVEAIKVTEKFGDELGSGVMVGFYVTAVVVNLSRVGNTVLAIDAEQRVKTSAIPFQRATVRYAQPGQTVFNVGGAYWPVAVQQHVGPPVPIAGNGVAAVCGTFFRLEAVAKQPTPLSVPDLVVTVTDAQHNRWTSAGVEPELVEAPQPSIRFI